MKKAHLLSIFCIGLVLLAMTACGGGGGGSAQNGTGTLSLSLTDATTDKYRAIYITVQEIQVHLGGNENSSNSWTSIDMPASPMTLDLLQLVNGVREDVGLATLPTGRYTQMRLILGRTADTTQNILGRDHPYPNYLIFQGVDTEQELKIPSGFNSGVKIVNGFDINTDQTTELVLDFDAGRSVVEAGSSGNWHLKPTIKVADLHEYAIVQGGFTNGTVGIEGALVSLQTYDNSAADAKDRVTVVAATITDEFGDFSLFVAPGTYQLVGYKSGHEVSVSRITVATGQVLDNGVTELTTSAPMSMGQVTGTVSLGNAAIGQYASMSFRQSRQVGGEAVQIEVKSINVMDGTTYAASLPGGSYILAASSYGHVSATHALIVTGGGTLSQDLTLTQ